ncbi:MAG TPA: VOC family protein [Opitutaceae bacterium]|nr:VOC family protein [Opitutaceae bacterium]
MITRLSHITIFVQNQNRALDFYTNKLGFTLESDALLGTFRWLTVRAPQQKELVLALLDPAAMYDDAPEALQKIQELQRSGKMGGGVFHTANCQETYEQLKAKGVKFRQSPEQRPYGTEAIFEDDSGNWFSLTQPSAKA